MKKYKAGLPYIDNALAVFITAVVNIISIFVFQWGESVSLPDIYMDGAIFGMVTTIVDVCVVYPHMKRMYKEGRLPNEVPRSKILSHFPRNPALFALVLGLVFSALALVFEWVFVKLFQIERMAFVSFLFFRILLAVFFSMYITRTIIYRYVQPAAFKGEIEQCGTDEVVSVLPRISILKEQFNAAISDFGLNMIIGTLIAYAFGGHPITEDRYLLIAPAVRSQMLISVIFFCLIVYLMMVLPVTRKICGIALRGEVPPAEKRNPLLQKLPKEPVLFSLLCVVPMFIFSYLFLYGIMTVMYFDILNFFQFYALRLILITLLTKGMAVLSLLRYMQPDVISSKNEQQREVA